MGKKKSVTYFADFETTQVNSNNEVNVYLWAIVSDDYEKVGYCLPSFFKEVSKLKGYIFFHNLKFDFSYIHAEILSRGETCEVMEKMGHIYSAKYKSVEFRDSMNYLNMSLYEVGKNYNKIYFKTSLEDILVQEGHVATKEEIEYCINDCRVVEEAYNNFFKSIEDVLEQAGSSLDINRLKKKITSAGIAFEAFKDLSDYEALIVKTTQQEFKRFRGAYKGGYVYSNRDLGLLNNVVMIDMNSMYPYVYRSKPLPYGKGFKFTDYEDYSKYEFSVIQINIKYELKKGYIPIIGGGVGKFGGTLYKSSSNGEFEPLTVCNIDFNRILEYYDCDFELVWGFGFNVKANFFETYVDTFNAMKVANTGEKRNVCKIFLNSPYGKTAMNGFQEHLTYTLEDGLVSKEITGWSVDPDTYQYLPMAIAITAYARKELLDEAQRVGFENVAYMDTDSIKFIDTNKVDRSSWDDDRLGAWKDEGHAVLFKTIAPKKYVYWDDRGKLSYTCAGISKKILSEKMGHNSYISKEEALKYINEFKAGLELECLQSRLVKGGRALIPIVKRIN